jgi:hypothetical protein
MSFDIEMTDKAEVVITVPRAKKGAWVAASRSQGRKLTDWLLERIDAPEIQNASDFDGFTLRVGAFYPFERYVLALPDADAREIFKRVRALDAQQDDVVAAIKIVKSYLEKRCCIADGTADRELFHDINSDALGYYSVFQELTHLDLLSVIVVDILPHLGLWPPLAREGGGFLRCYA